MGCVGEVFGGVGAGSSGSGEENFLIWQVNEYMVPPTNKGNCGVGGSYKTEGGVSI